MEKLKTASLVAIAVSLVAGLVVFSIGGVILHRDLARLGGEIAAVREAVVERLTPEAPVTIPEVRIPEWKEFLRELLRELRARRMEKPEAISPLAPSIRVEVTGVERTEEQISVALKVCRSGPAALLFYDPILVDEEGNDYQVTSESLDEAKFDLMGREAETELVFTPAPPEGAKLTLVFNPQSYETNPVAPRIEVPIE